MSDFQRNPMDQDEDRLPWLEPVDDYEDDEGISIARLIGAVVVGLVALGLVIGGIFWLRNRDAGGEGTLIAAPEGPIKERPSEPGGMEVDGTGDVAYDASLGQDVNSTIDLTALPEAPVTENAPVRTAELPPSKAPAATAPAASGKPPVAKATDSATPAPKPAVAAPKPLLPGATPSAPSGGAVQLGAFSSQALANKAWNSLSGRFGFLAGFNHSVIPVSVGGKTLYRLRAEAGGQASSTCAKLKVAGEACSVVN
ncbi:MAG: SPOR domain-containing protein [Sphingomonadaceae bacterium]